MPIRKRRKRRISPYHHLLRWLVVFLFILGLAGAIFVLNNPFIKELDVRSLLQANLRASTVIDRHGEELLTLSPSRVIWTPLEKIPFFLRRAVVAVEDRRFYEHRGVDFIGILRAVYYNLRSRQRVQGGSTITQQLAKNLLLSNEKTISRKLLEVGYAVEIERKYSKDEILEFYLNDIYFGHGVYGVESAARFYFAKHIWELTMEEQAVLVGLIRGPEFYSPYRRPEKTLERRNLVLEVLLTQRYISEREYEQLSAKPLIVQEDPTYLSRSGYFADYIEEWLAQQYAWSYRYIRSGGLRIYTTLDAYTQRIAEETISSLPRNEKAIKPLVFAAAIEAGFTPETKVIDEPVTYLVNGKPWSPQNFDNKYRGIIPLRDALAWSVNTVAVRLVDELGVKQIFSFIQRMGLPLVEKGARNDQALAPLALGGLTEGVTPIELCSSFTALANQGIRSLPVGVIRVEDDQGRVLRRGSFRQEQVIRAETAWAVTDMMQGVITYGTGRSADPGRPAAGKTGTSNENTDAWFVGFTPELVVVLWIGNDDRSPLRIGERIIGGGTAAEYWGSFVRRALVRNTVKDF